MPERLISFFKDRLELVMVLLTMVGMFTTGVWWTSKLDSRILMLEEWKNEAKPIISKVDVFELRIERQYQLLQKIESTLTDLQKNLWVHMGADNNKSK